MERLSLTAITGHNGKTTTTTLIDAMLRGCRQNHCVDRHDRISISRARAAGGEHHAPNLSICFAM